MTELPKKIQKRIDELGAYLERHTPGHVPYQKFMEAIAQELYADLALAMEALEKISKDMGTDYSDGNTLIAHNALRRLRAKYQDQETEGGK